MTQPDDPRRVKVIVELIDHTARIADLNERGDLPFVSFLEIGRASCRERVSSPV